MTRNINNNAFNWRNLNGIQQTGSIRLDITRQNISTNESYSLTNMNGITRDKSSNFDINNMNGIS
ncbi:MAG: hypothetical protein GX184_08010 [Clostridiaceae bacterium]|nr:hypothetical protein [Clostridiaceae bacterium]